jgi:hypothetical protein
MYAIAEEGVNRGSLRETFVLSQLKPVASSIDLSSSGDFLLNEKYTLEVGGKNKTNAQIRNQKNAFRVLDDVSAPYDNVIPIWMFGFLY